MVPKERALPGRAVEMRIAEKHYVTKNDMKAVPDGFKVAYFANGCFWGSEKGIWRLPGDGIFATAVGYAASRRKRVSRRLAMPLSIAPLSRDIGRR